MSVCLLKLIFGENKVYFIRKVISVYSLQTIRINSEQARIFIVICWCETLLLCHQYLLRVNDEEILPNIDRRLKRFDFVQIASNSYHLLLAFVDILTHLLLESGEEGRMRNCCQKVML